MLALENEDLHELMSLLDRASQTAMLLPEAENRTEELKGCRQALAEFHATAAMLGATSLSGVGAALEEYFSSTIETATNVDSGQVTPLVEALGTLLGQMRDVTKGGDEVSPDFEQIKQILNPDLVAPSAEPEPVEARAAKPAAAIAPEPVAEVAAATESLDFSRLERIAGALGGKLAFSNGNGCGATFQISFSASAANLEKIEALLSPCDPNSQFAEQLSRSDNRLERILQTIKDFLMAFSSGDLSHCQEILLYLAEQQHQAGLYQEIGVLARELHDSLRGFASTLDPALREMVENKIPDSGNRLEHILQLTEKAANTTLDQVETLQRTNQKEQTALSELQQVLGYLQPLGDKAQVQLSELKQRITDLQASSEKSSESLITILTAQDYQDLTGQIILKIIQLLKDLELKLVNVIRTFGIRTDQQKKAVHEELYGPVHSGKEDALHSQDDVDSLLADFGF